MKVSDVRWQILEGLDPHGIGGRPRTRRVLVVRVETDAGVHGLGEAPLFLGVIEALDACASWLRGREPFDVAVFVRTMLYGGLPPYRPWTSPTATPTGPIAWAVSGVEMALHDLIGKALGVPVHVLLGGKVRDRVRVYLDRSGPPDVADPEAWRAIPRRALADGFRDMKFDIDQVAPELTSDTWNRSISLEQMNVIVERLSFVREAAGPDAEIALDCHMQYDVPTAIQLAQRLAPLLPRWLEDPVPITNSDALAEVRAKSPIPICAGEMFVLEQVRLFIDRGACDIFHPDVLFIGGLAEARGAARLAELSYLQLALHNMAPASPRWPRPMSPQPAPTSWGSSTTSLTPRG